MGMEGRWIFLYRYVMIMTQAVCLGRAVETRVG